MIRSAVAAVLLVAAVPAAAQSDDARSAIEQVMARSAAGWSAGDLDAFLAIYSDDPSVTFTTSDGVVRGKAAVRARYLRDYPQAFGDRATAATVPALRFDYDSFRPVGDDHMMVIARWHLGSGVDAATGLTSVLFRREAGGWRIVADHS